MSEFDTSLQYGMSPMSKYNNKILRSALIKITNEGITCADIARRANLNDSWIDGELSKFITGKRSTRNSVAQKLIQVIKENWPQFLTNTAPPSESETDSSNSQTSSSAESKETEKEEFSKSIRLSFDEFQDTKGFLSEKRICLALAQLYSIDDPDEDILDIIESLKDKL